MAGVLPFPSKTPPGTSLTKTDTGGVTKIRLQRSSIPLTVVSIVLPTGEGLPILVRSDTWAPMELALRWTVFARRFEVAESTLGSNLRGLRYLYVWGAGRFDGGLETRLQQGPLDASDLTNLKEFLRAPDFEDLTIGTSGTAGRAPGSETAAGARALTALLFLRWAISPSNRNERGAEPAGARDALTQLDVILGPLANRAGQGGERQAPTVALLDLMEEQIRPVQDEAGRFRMPLQWRHDNPFKPATRLRNWLMWQIARNCGPRIGELLALKLQDVR